MKMSRMPVSRKGDSLKRILFLCEDNFLASRFCEEYFNSLVRDLGLNWQAASRALSPEAARQHPEPMSADAVRYLRSSGVAPVNHRRLPLGVTDFDLEMSNFVLVIAHPDDHAAIRDAWKHTGVCLRFLDPGAQAGTGRLAALAHGVDCLFDEMLGQEYRNDVLPGGLHRASAVSAKLAPLPGSADGYCHVGKQQLGRKFIRSQTTPG